MLTLRPGSIYAVKRGREPLRRQAAGTAAGDYQQCNQGPDPMHNSHRECGGERGEKEESSES